MAQSLGGGGLEGQRSLDLDRYAFLGRKLTSFEGSCMWPKALGGGLEGQRFLDLDRYAFFGPEN